MKGQEHEHELLSLAVSDLTRAWCVLCLNVLLLTSVSRSVCRLCLMLSPARLILSVVARRRSLCAADEADQWSPTKPSSALFDMSEDELEAFFASLFSLFKSALYSLSFDSKGPFLSGGRLLASKSIRLICSHVTKAEKTRKNRKHIVQKNVRE